MNVQGEYEKITKYLENAKGWDNIDSKTADYLKERFQLLFTLVNQQQQQLEQPKGLDYNELFKFMKEFNIDILNRYEELIIDEPSNTYTTISGCKDIEDVKTHVVYSLCRPIGKGLDNRTAARLLKRLNDYFKVDLTKNDMRLMYQELCYERKLPEFKDFIKRGFPMDELKGEE